VFSSGYLANLGVVTALSGPGSLIVSDGANHASLIDACRLSRARVQVVAHNDVEGVEQRSPRAPSRAPWCSPTAWQRGWRSRPLAALHQVARARGALLVVDEAHGLGVCGPAGADCSPRPAWPGRMTWWPP